MSASELERLRAENAALKAKLEGSFLFLFFVFVEKKIATRVFYNSRCLPLSFSSL
jgi:hypothetical protein